MGSTRRRLETYLREEKISRKITGRNLNSYRNNCWIAQVVSIHAFEIEISGIRSKWPLVRNLKCLKHSSDVVQLLVLLDRTSWHLNLRSLMYVGLCVNQRLISYGLAFC